MLKISDLDLSDQRVLILGDATFVERTMAALHDAKLEPHQIDLEVTETTLLDDKGGVVRTLNALKRHGVKMSIDDFGTFFLFGESAKLRRRLSETRRHIH